MSTITIVHGKNSVKGIYKDNVLVATQDKGCSLQELEDCIQQHGGDKPKIIDTDSTCGNVLEMPSNLKPKPVPLKVKNKEKSTN